MYTFPENVHTKDRFFGEGINKALCDVCNIGLMSCVCVL